MEISRLDSLRLGSSKEDKFWGGEHITFRGTEWHWSSTTEYKGGGGKRVYRKLTANEGGSVKNVSVCYGEIR